MKARLWVLSRHADVLAAVKDPDTYSSAQGIVPSGFIAESPNVIVLDPPAHTMMRKAVMRVFTPRRIAALEGRIREFTRQLIGTFPDRGEVDAFEYFTDPLPIYVIAELLGVDPGEREMFKRCGDVIVYSSNADPAQLLSAQRELTDYLAGVFEDRRRAPCDDLISVLLMKSPEGRALSEEELLGLCFLLSWAPRRPRVRWQRDAPPRTLPRCEGTARR